MQTSSANGTLRCAPRLTLNVERLNALRRAAGIKTDAEFARIIGVSPITFYRIRQRISLPSSEFMARVKASFPSASLDLLFDLGEVGL